MADYDTASSRTSYYEADSRVPSRLWAGEKLLLDLAALGMIDLFKGPGPDPSLLGGFGPQKVWLRQNPGVQPQPGATLIWTGLGSSSSEANWVPLSFQRFRELVVGGLVPVEFAVLISTWFSSLPTSPDGLPSGDFWNNGGTIGRVP